MSAFSSLLAAKWTTGTNGGETTLRCPVVRAKRSVLYYVRPMCSTSMIHFRSLLGALALLLLCAVAQAQGEKGSLTEQFPKMSAKERARIAAKEGEDALQDKSYQAFMQEAEKAFQEGLYESALDRYEKARALRPFNVYPKVKIEDLKALLAKQGSVLSSEPPPEPVIEPSTAIATSSTQPPEAIVPQNEKPVQLALGEPPTIKHADPVEDPLIVEPRVAEKPVDLKKADGQIERRYKEGHAFVIERVVTVDGHLVVYKRVFHNWGQVFYFEDGVAVDERVWKARFQQ